MNKQPEALRLADHLQEYWDNYDEEYHAAAELRRLHQVNQELAEALTSIAEYWNQDANHEAIVDACHYAIDTARAAIAKATGEQA